jgi:hypothetical protein
MSHSKGQTTTTSAADALTDSSTTESNSSSSSSSSTTTTTTASTAVPMFSKAWFTHGRIAIMGLMGLGAVMLVSYGWWWLQGATRRLPPFQSRDEDSEEHRARCYAERESGGSYLSLPLGTFHLSTLSLERMGSIRVPTGMLVEVHSIHTLVPKAAPAAGDATDASSDTQKASNDPADNRESTAAATSLLPPPAGFEWRLAPPPTRCLPGMVTDVSRLDWSAAQRLVVRRVTDEEYGRVM